MSGYSPPSLPTELRVAIAVLCVAWLAYSVLVVHQILLGVLVVVLVALGYVVWRFLGVLEAIADALQRLADQRSE